jgi:hypothetical protein
MQIVNQGLHIRVLAPETAVFAAREELRQLGKEHL